MHALQKLINFLIVPSGEWRQYIPTTEKLMAMIRFYSVGIFNNAPPPFKVTGHRKHSPLQRLAYLGIKLLILPLISISGLACLYYNELNAAGTAVAVDVGVIAILHNIGAFLMLAFLIAHVYIITTGHTWNGQLKAMIAGREEVEEQ